jgi:hypothetical protein
LNTLKKRFGNEDTIIKKKLLLFEKIAPPTEDKPSSIKSFYETLLDLKATLTNLEATKYLESPQTLSTVVDKLSPPLKRAWVKYTLGSEEAAELDDFTSWFEFYYNCAIVLDDGKSEPRKRDHHLNVHQVAPLTNKIVADSKDQEKSEDSKKCVFCRNVGHDILVCRKFVKHPLGKKLEFLKKGRWCFCCLIARHWTESCPNKRECGVEDCKEFHHKLLHKSPQQDKDSGKNEFTGVHHLSHSSDICYRLLPVKLSHNN